MKAGAKKYQVQGGKLSIVSPLGVTYRTPIPAPTSFVRNKDALDGINTELQQQYSSKRSQNSQREGEERVETESWETVESSPNSEQQTDAALHIRIPAAGGGGGKSSSVVR